METLLFPATKVSADCLMNVAFWSFTTPDGETLQWSIYKDADWLNCFVSQPNYSKKIDSKERIWEIDFKRGLVTQIFISKFIL